MRPTILLTRPKEGSARFAEQLRQACGSEVRILCSPVLRIDPVAFQADLTGYKALIFTSANAVPFVAPGLRCYTVGDATARAAQAAGMHPTSVGANAEALVRRILADGDQGPLLHLRGQHTRGDVARTLSEAGCATDEQIVYSQTECALTEEALRALASSLPVIVPLFSPRSARIFAWQLPENARVWVAALSPAVAEVFAGMAISRMEIATTPDAKAMLSVTQGLMDAVTRLEG